MEGSCPLFVTRELSKQKGCPMFINFSFRFVVRVSLVFLSLALALMFSGCYGDSCGNGGRPQQFTVES